MSFQIPFPSGHKWKTVKMRLITAAYAVIPDFIVCLIGEIHNTSAPANRHSPVAIINSVFHSKPPGGIVARLVYVSIYFLLG